LKLAPKAKFPLTDQVTKLTANLMASESDIDDLMVKRGDSEKREESHLAEMTQCKEKLLEVTQKWDDVIFERD